MASCEMARCLHLVLCPRLTDTDRHVLRSLGLDGAKAFSRTRRRQVGRCLFMDRRLLVKNILVEDMACHSMKGNKGKIALHRLYCTA